MSAVAHQTIKKVDLKKEDFVFEGVFLSDVSELDRSRDQKSNLIFVKIVGAKTMAATPSFLYFGDLTIQELNDLRGSKVDVQLGFSDRGANVKVIQPIS